MGGGGGAMGGGGGASCSAATCAQGCCAGGTCQPGTTTAQCGKQGAACVACPATDLCKADQTCGLDPAGRWQLQPTSAQVAPDNFGVGWDSFGGAPDTFLELWCPATQSNITSSTPTVTNDYAPTWTSGSCTATAAQWLADGLGFDAWEDDGLSDDLMTAFTVVPLSETDLRAGTKTIGPAEGLDSLTFTLTKL